jgi:hypothetical protein
MIEFGSWKEEDVVWAISLVTSSRHHDFRTFPFPFPP